MKSNPQPPQRVPVLTEVVVMPEAALSVAEVYPPLDADPAYAVTEPAPLGPWPGGAVDAGLGAPPFVDEAALAQRVLVNLDHQLDLMFEQRVKEALTPILTRTTDTLVREMRNQLAASLRDMVTRAVSQELERLHKR